MADRELGFRGKLETPFDSYKPFFNGDESNRLQDLTKNTAMEWPVFDLFINWEGLSNTHAMPSSMLQMMKAIWNGFHVRDTLGFARQLTEHTRNALLQEGNFSDSQREQIGGIMGDAAEQYAAAMEKVLHPDFPHDDLWDDLCGQAQFVIGVAATQKSVYGSLYHHYEDFIRETVGVIKGEPDYRPKNTKALVADIRQYLGDAIVDKCVSDAEVSTARLVRNALAHSGGKETSELNKNGHHIYVVEGRLQIMPTHSRMLYNLLHQRATLVIETALNLLAAKSN